MYRRVVGPFLSGRSVSDSHAVTPVIHSRRIYASVKPQTDVFANYFLMLGIFGLQSTRPRN